MAIRGFLFLSMMLGYSRRLPLSILPAADQSLALGALSIHRPRLEAALFQPALDLVFREAEVRLNSQVRDESSLRVAVNRLAVNP
jgi:hypothetical protein